jgi:hypothetical protein
MEQLVKQCDIRRHVRNAHGRIEHHQHLAATAKAQGSGRKRLPGGRLHGRPAKIVPDRRAARGRGAYLHRMGCGIIGAHVWDDADPVRRVPDQTEQAYTSQNSSDLAVYDLHHVGFVLPRRRWRIVRLHRVGEVRKNLIAVNAQISLDVRGHDQPPPAGKLGSHPTARFRAWRTASGMRRMKRDLCRLS